MGSGATSRRNFLLGATGALGCFPTSILARTKALKDIAAESGILFGSAIDYPDCHVFLDEKVGQIYAEQCAIFATGYQPLWSQNQPSPTVPFDFSNTDKVFEFAEKNGGKVAAHPLIWHQFVPTWVERQVLRENGKKIIETHIQNLMDRYRGRVHYWVVVNEPFDWNQRRNDGLIPCPYADAFGEEYIDLSFAAAQDVDPHALLVLNEVGLEHEYPDARRKRRKIIQTIKRLQGKGIRVDAIGIQGHLRPDFPFNNNAFRAFINRIKHLGLEVIITELDVDDRALPSNIDRRDEQVGRNMRRFINSVVGTNACRTVVTWGLLNEFSWLNRPAPNMDKWDLRNPRQDGQPHRPLLYDKEVRPTPAWDAMAKALSGFDVPAR